MLRVDNLDNGGVIVPAPAGTPAVDTGDQPGHSTERTAGAAVDTQYNGHHDEEGDKECSYVCK